MRLWISVYGSLKPVFFTSHSLKTLCSKTWCEKQLKIVALPGTAGAEESDSGLVRNVCTCARNHPTLPPRGCSLHTAG